MSDEEILNWLAEIFEEKPGEITADMSRDDIPTWDSLGVLSLMAGLDEKFGIQLEEEELARLNSVAEVLNVIKRDKQSQAA